MAKRHRHGQMIGGEYGILLMIAIVAVSTMMLYVRRAIDGQVRDADVRMIEMARLGSENTVNVALEYEPYYTKSRMLSTSSSKDNSKIVEGADVTKTTDSSRIAILNTYQLPPASSTGKVQGINDGF